MANECVAIENVIFAKSVCHLKKYIETLPD